MYLMSINRDIKPDNILLDSEGHVHLTDFNVAIHYSEKRLHTSVAGSMAYMAPEILASEISSFTLQPHLIICSREGIYMAC